MSSTGGTRRRLSTIGAVALVGALVAGGSVIAAQRDSLSLDDVGDDAVVDSPATSPAAGVGDGTGDGQTAMAPSDRATQQRSITDPAGDADFAWSDIVSSSVSIDDDGEVTATVVLEEWTSPTSDDWVFGDTSAAWPLDVDGDGAADAEVRLGVRDEEFTTAVVRNGTVRCVGEAGSDGAAKSYSATFSVACVGNPESLRFRSGFEFDDVTFDIESSDVGPDSGWSAEVPNPVFVAPLVTIDPARLYDSREGPGRRAPDTVTEIDVTGVGGVPDDALAVLLNVTAVLPDQAGFTTVFPCGTERSETSNLNYQPGKTRPNAVLAKVGAGGTVCVYNLRGLDLVVDVNGYVPRLSDVVSLAPERAYDSRQGPGVRQAGTTTEVDLAGQFGIPGDASGVILNVTAANAVDNGFITVFPCGTDLPEASNVNFRAGENAPNAVVARIGDDGAVCFYVHRDIDLIVDVNGYLPATTAVQGIDPVRLFDSREGPGRRTGGSTTEIRVTGVGGVPNGATGVILNVTAVNPAANGFVTVFPCGTAQPEASNLNYRPGENIPNAVVARVGAGGEVCFFTLRDIDLVVDVNGFVP